jgi:hypothetical protein
MNFSVFESFHLWFGLHERWNQWPFIAMVPNLNALNGLVGSVFTHPARPLHISCGSEFRTECFTGVDPHAKAPCALMDDGFGMEIRSAESNYHALLCYRGASGALTSLNPPLGCPLDSSVTPVARFPTLEGSRGSDVARWVIWLKGMGNKAWYWIAPVTAAWKP